MNNEKEVRKGHGVFQRERAELLGVCAKERSSTTAHGPGKGVQVVHRGELQL